MEKIAIIGARGFQRRDEDVRIECFAWNRLNKIKNLRDYDVIIIDLLTIKDPEDIKWKDLLKHLIPAETAAILTSECNIFVIGDPRFELQEPAKNRKKIVSKPFLAWTGMEFFWDKRPGDTVDFQGRGYWGYREYIKYLKKWDYSLRKAELDLSVFEKIVNMDNLRSKGQTLDVHENFFCRNRYGYALAFAITLAFKGRTIEPLPGGIVFLPRINLGEDETLALILKDICGVEISVPEPGWIEEIKAPGQKKIDDEIVSIKSEIQSLEEKLSDAELHRKEARSCLRLLYDRGLSLEEAVRDVFRKLGADVETPENPGKEDGWISVQAGDETYQGVLEVKGTRNDEFDETGRRQLSEWIQNGIDDRDKVYKGIFVGNNATEKPVDERPEGFSNSWKRAAKRQKIAVLKSADLYVVYKLRFYGRLSDEDMLEFWQRLFETNGIFDTRPYWEMLKSEEKTDEKRETNS